MHRFRIAERPRAIGGRSVLRKRERRKAMEVSGRHVFRRRDGGKRLSREGGEMGGALRGGAAPPLDPCFTSGRARTQGFSLA